jgi:hypothetical protein
MNIARRDPPRRYRVGAVEIADCGKIDLAADEQVTFVHGAGEVDFTAKSWGFYATPSVNDRLVRQGFKTALAENPGGKIFVHVVSRDRLEEYHRYLAAENSRVVEWLDERPRRP